MTRSSLSVAAAILILLAVGPAAAQTSTAPGVMSRPLSVGLLGGVSAGSGDAGPSVGAGLTFDVTDRVAVEGRSIFLRRGSGTHGMELTGTALVTIARSQRAAPYLAIGGGLYRASFAPGDSRFFGQMGSGFTTSQMPMFYANRLGQLTSPLDGRWMMRSFTDPALTVGGGVRINLTNRWYVRPDVRALVVFAEGDRMALTSMVVGIGYRF